jgi:predicted DNA-binding transcriptional regulator YafY
LGVDKPYRNHHDKNLQTLCRDCHEDKHYCKFLDKKFDANNDYGVNYRPSAKIQTIIRAVNNKSKVKINYVDRDGVKSLRIISPKKIYKGYRYQGKTVCVNCVYVDAYCEKDCENRTFRLSRMGTIDNI